MNECLAEQSNIFHSLKSAPEAKFQKVRIEVEQLLKGYSWECTVRTPVSSFVSSEGYNSMNLALSSF